MRILLSGKKFPLRKGGVRGLLFFCAAVLLLFCVVVVSLPCHAFAGTVELPKTGQTKSYAAGDDGDIRAGVAWPNPRLIDSGDGTITDALTGLMWLKDANCAATIAHDPDSSGDGSMSWLNALDFIKGINNHTYDISSCSSYSANYSDWHLPNINELETLLSYGTTTMSVWLLSSGFTNIQDRYYWSATSGTYPYSGASKAAAKVLHLQFGYTASYPKVYSPYNPYHILPVRQTSLSAPAKPWRTGQNTCYGVAGDIILCNGTGQDGEIQAGAPWPQPRFKDNGDGTVTDNLSGLMWTKNDCVLGYNEAWQNKLDGIAQMNVGQRENYGYSDWRLPNIKELRSLLSNENDSSALPSGNPFTFYCGHSWASTTSLSDGTERAWMVSFFGDGDQLSNDKTLGGAPGWPVRGGQDGGPFGDLEHVVLIIVDGLRKDTLYNALDSSEADDSYPNLKALFKNQPSIRIENTLTTFPTVTFSANASLVTGCYPNEHGISGNIWMDRYVLQNTGSDSLAKRYYTDIEFESIQLIKPDIARVYTEGLATKDLKVETMYDLASKKGLTSRIIYHMYSKCGQGGIVQNCNPINSDWIKPDIKEGILFKLDPGEYDRNMIYDAAKSIEERGLPNLLTLYFSGNDGNSHANGVDDQARYLRDLIDPLLGIFMNGGTLNKYNYLGSLIDQWHFDGLKKLTGINLDKTVFVITADHGQHNVNSIKKKWRSTSDFFMASNGGMVQVYIKSKKPNSWAAYPVIETINQYAKLLMKNKPQAILTRNSRTANNWTTQYQLYFGTIPREYQDVENRLLNFASDRSGDIILLPKINEEYDSTQHKANHGVILFNIFQLKHSDKMTQKVGYNKVAAGIK